jgi:hypothetical protein
MPVIKAADMTVPACKMQDEVQPVGTDGAAIGGTIDKGELAVLHIL